MKKSWITLTLAAALVHATAQESPPPSADESAARKKLAGVWKGFAVEGNGERPDRGPVKLELTISETTIEGIESKGQGTIDHGAGKFTLDLTQNPAWLDASKTNDPAIFEDTDGRVYLLYSVAGEAGIGIAELTSK